MSTANTTTHTPVQQLIEQRLDAIDRALMGLLPRPDRVAAVAQVEMRIHELAAANPAFAASLQAPTQGLPLADSAFSSLAADAPAFLPHPQLSGLVPGRWIPSTQKRRSRLAVSAGVLGILALALLFATPVTCFTVEILGEVLGDIVAIAFMGAHALAVAVGGVAAVGLAIAALVSLRRHKEHLVGHGWAIAGLCAGPLPILLGCAAVLFVGLQMGVAEFLTVSAPMVAGDFDIPTANESAYGNGPARSAVSAPCTADIPQSISSPSPIQSAGYEAPTATTQPPTAGASGLAPTPPTSLSSPPQPAQRADPLRQTESQPAPCLEPSIDPVLTPESAPGISKEFLD